VPILLHKPFWGAAGNFLGPLMRFARGGMGTTSIRAKPITELRIGTAEYCSGGAGQKSTFAAFSASFDFRLLQQTSIDISA
jgi:hypothetical protein